LEVRLVPSAADLMSAMAPTVEQVDHAIVTLQNDVTSFRQAIVQQIAQETAYIQQQVDQLLGIAPSPSPAASVPPSGNSGSGSGSGATMTAHNASNTSLDTTAQKVGTGSGTGATTTGHENGAKQGIRPMVGSGSSGSGGSSINNLGSGSIVNGVGSGSGSSAPPGDAYEWAPEPSHPGSGLGSSQPYVGNNLASNWHNWWKNGYPQQSYNATLPGNKPGDTVTFGYGQAGSLGQEPIEWDEDLPFSEMFLINYNAAEKVDSGETINVTGKSTGNSVQMDANSTLSLKFADATSSYEIDRGSTITNMTLYGNPGGSFIVKGGTMTIANGNYKDYIGTKFIVATGATLQDWGKCPLIFTQTETLQVNGTMGVNHSQNGLTLIEAQNGVSDCFVEVEAGKLIYSGTPGVTDTFAMPVWVNSGGTFALMAALGQNQGGKLIVKGAAFSDNTRFSVSMTEANSSVQLWQQSTLECDNFGYLQTGGTLETMDGTTCTLQNPAPGNASAFIRGGTVSVAQGSTSFGELDVNCATMFFGAATLNVGISGNSTGTNDQLIVSGDLDINNPANSFLRVPITWTGQPAGGGKWTIITASNQLNAFQAGNLTYANAQGINFNATANKPKNGQYQISC
jgi:hypothetical protein